MATTDRRIAREMILPDWAFIRREAAVAWRDFYAPFKGILEALAALRNARLVQEGSFDSKAVLLGTSTLGAVVHESESEPLRRGADIDLIDAGPGQDMLIGAADLVFREGRADFRSDESASGIGSDKESMRLRDALDEEYGGEDVRGPRETSEGIILEIESRLHRLIETRRESVSDVQSSVLVAAAEACAARRQLHALFGQRLFSDPSWDILLELFVSTLEGRKVTVSTACMAAGAPTTTALRHIAYLVNEGLAVRCPHPADARSTYLELTSQAITRLTQYFSESGTEARGRPEPRSLRRGRRDDDRHVDKRQLP